ncbi:MAG: EamA family transporter [Clostridiaceae bacterium]|nr:EamA family transporter [Clostridiaceae bacterium]
MLYLGLALLFYCIQNIANKEFGKTFPVKLRGIVFLDAMAMTVVVIVIGLIGGVHRVSGAVLLLAAGFGVAYASTIILLQNALALGPMGATKLLYNFYMVFPVLFSIFFCGETLTLPILLGIVCMAGVTVLSVPRDKDPDPNRLKKDIFRWFIVTLLATASNGVLTIVKRSLSWQFPEADTASFTFWGFAFAAVICWSVVIVFKWRKQDFSTWTAHPRLMARFVLAVGLSTALASLFQMLSLETVPGVVVFPLTSGGVLLLLWVYAAIAYREPVRKRGVFTLLLGLTGAFLLSFF